MVDYAKLYKEQEAEEKGLTTRQDDDRDLLYLKKYELLDAANKKVKDIISVTLNKPAVFAANVISALNSTKQQVIVETEDHSIDTHEVEQFQEAGFNAANTKLVNAGEPTLNFFTDAQASVRGRATRLVLFRVENEELVPDISSWDSRFVRGERGEDDWVWKGYKTVRSKGDILAEYGIDVGKKAAPVLNIWTPEVNQIWLDGKQHNSVEGFKPMEQENPYGFVPFTHAYSGFGSGTPDNDPASLAVSRLRS
ncbi:hypothetical protein LCGC14_2776820, partial [marine sediment metagenome]